MAARRLPRSLVALSASAIAAVYLAGYAHTQDADRSLAGADGGVAVAQAAPASTVALASAPTLVPTPFTAPTLPFERFSRGDDGGSRSGGDGGSGGDRRRGGFTSPGQGQVPNAASRGAPPSAPSLAPAPAPPASAPAPAGPSGGGVTASAAYRDGTYAGQGTSRRGGVAVSVTVQGGRVASVQVTRATTQYPISRINTLPGQVVSRQSAQVDLVSGATYSAMAFRDAVAQALAQAKA